MVFDTEIEFSFWTKVLSFVCIYCLFTNIRQFFFYCTYSIAMASWNVYSKLKKKHSSSNNNNIKCISMIHLGYKNTYKCWIIIILHNSTSNFCYFVCLVPFTKMQSALFILLLLLLLLFVFLLPSYRKLQVDEHSQYVCFFFICLQTYNMFM